jgi:hypothetical protein
VAKYIKWLNDHDNYPKIEELCIEILGNPKISVEDRAGFGAAIFSINKFYNAKSNLE